MVNRLPSVGTMFSATHCVSNFVRLVCSALSIPTMVLAVPFSKTYWANLVNADRLALLRQMTFRFDNRVNVPLPSPSSLNSAMRFTVRAGRCFTVTSLLFCAA